MAFLVRFVSLISADLPAVDVCVLCMHVDINRCFIFSASFLMFFYSSIAEAIIHILDFFQRSHSPVAYGALFYCTTL